MSNSVIQRAGDLETRPVTLPVKQMKSHVSVGDMHGNALKLIYVLIEEGVLDVNKDNYRQLRDIYKKPVSQLTKADLQKFERIVQEANVDASRSLTLIGDELADRGNNDFYTLLVLKKLHDSKLDVDIMVSNHSVEFLRDYVKSKFTGQYMLGPGQGQSLTNMQALIQRGLVDENVVRQMVQTTYQPMVKGIGYTISEDGSLSIFSHAPIGLETIEALAQKFNIPYQEDSPLALITTINAINEEIQVLFSQNQLAWLIDDEGHSDPRKPISPTKPLMRMVWNRALGSELRTEPRTQNYQVNFVHGHIGDGAIKQHGQALPSHQNLDTSFGKHADLFKTGTVQGYGQVQHLSRQSDGFTSKQLAAMSPETLKTTALVAVEHEKRMALIQRSSQLSSTLGKMFRDSDIRKRFNEDYLKFLNKGTSSTVYENTLNTLNDELNVLLKSVQKFEFEMAMKDLNIKSREFQNQNPDSDVAIKCKAMVDALTQHAADYFKPQGIELQDFVTQCKKTITDATSELKHHRGFWYSKVPQAIRTVLGVLASPMFAIGWALGLCSGQDYKKTFFKTPATDSLKKIAQFKESLRQITGRDLEADEENQQISVYSNM